MTMSPKTIFGKTGPSIVGNWHPNYMNVYISPLICYFTPRNKSFKWCSNKNGNQERMSVPNMKVHFSVINNTKVRALV